MVETMRLLYASIIKVTLDKVDIRLIEGREAAKLSLPIILTYVYYVYTYFSVRMYHEQTVHIIYCVGLRFFIFDPLIH